MYSNTIEFSYVYIIEIRGGDGVWYLNAKYSQAGGCARRNFEVFSFSNFWSEKTKMYNVAFVDTVIQQTLIECIYIFIYLYVNKIEICNHLVIFNFTIVFFFLSLIWVFLSNEYKKLIQFVERLLNINERNKSTTLTDGADIINKLKWEYWNAKKISKKCYP